MSDFVDRLERDLVAAARRRAAADAPASWRRRLLPWSLRSILLATVIVGGGTGAGAAATLYTLRGSVIPAPSASDVPATQTPVPSSARVSTLRAADPRAGVPPWTIRVARSDTGYTCSTVGQVRDGRFGLVGLDGRFRELAGGVTDACGQSQRNAATLVGARLFDARRRADRRTVVSGVGGDALRRVRLRTVRGARDVPVGEGGTFVAVFAGYPEDVGAETTLTFADGHRQTERTGIDPSLVLDPDGGPAWRPQGYMVGEDARQCVSFGPARQSPSSPQSPGVCGLLNDPRDDRSPQRGYYFAVRRLSDATVDRGPRLGANVGTWKGAAPRTAVWGGVGTNVRSVSVDGPGTSGDRQIDRPISGSILAVFDGRVRPRDVVIRIRMKDGSVRVAHGDTNLVARRVPVPEIARRRANAAARRDRARARDHRRKGTTP